MRYSLGSIVWEVLSWDILWGYLLGGTVMIFSGGY